MLKFGKQIVRSRFVILIVALLLLIPSVIGFLNTRINYDILYYLPDDIDIFLNMPDSDASQLAEALEHGLAGVYLKDGERTVRLEGIVPQLRLFAEKRNLLEQALRVMPGVSALLLFFTYPFLLHFMRLKGLGRALRSSGAGRAVILLCFDRDIRLVRSVSAVQPAKRLSPR